MQDHDHNSIYVHKEVCRERHTPIEDLKKKVDRIHFLLVITSVGVAVNLIYSFFGHL